VIICSCSRSAFECCCVARRLVSAAALVLAPQLMRCNARDCEWRSDVA
jgi:hypothetical protein